MPAAYDLVFAYLSDYTVTSPGELVGVEGRPGAGMCAGGPQLGAAGVIGHQQATGQAPWPD